MNQTPGDAALLDEALTAIGKVLARMDLGTAVPSEAVRAVQALDSVRVRDVSVKVTPEHIAIQCCLASASALLDVSQTLIRQPAHLSPQQRAHHWNKLIEQTKAAGRASYRAALALTDPQSD